jgi:hypothetical protein
MCPEPAQCQSQPLIRHLTRQGQQLRGSDHSFRSVLGTWKWEDGVSVNALCVSCLYPVFTIVVSAKQSLSVARASQARRSSATNIIPRSPATLQAMSEGLVVVRHAKYPVLTRESEKSFFPPKSRFCASHARAVADKIFAAVWLARGIPMMVCKASSTMEKVRCRCGRMIVKNMPTKLGADTHFPTSTRRPST